MSFFPFSGCPTVTNWCGAFLSTQIQQRLRLVTLTQKDSKSPQRYVESMAMLLSIKEEALANIEEVKQRLAELAKKANKSKVAASGESDATAVAPPSGQDKGKGRATSPEAADDDDASDEENEPSEDPDEDEDVSEGSTNAKDPIRRVKGGYQLRLRECRIILHQAYFMLGDVCNRLGKSKEEDENYQAAELLRRSLLAGNERRAAKAMDELSQNEVKNGVSIENLTIALSGEPNDRTEDLVRPSLNDINSC